MRGFSRLFPNHMVSLGRKHVLVSVPEIAKGMTALVLWWDFIPKFLTGFFATVSPSKSDDLSGSSAQRDPKPSLVSFDPNK
jgi:hypothetical protein